MSVVNFAAMRIVAAVVAAMHVLADVIMADVVTGLVSALGVVAARVHGFMNDGGGNTMNVLNGRAHNGSSAVVAAVLHGMLEVLAGDIARAVKTRNKRHCGWDSESNLRCTMHLLFLNAVLAAAHTPVGQTNADGCGDRTRPRATRYACHR